MTNNISLSIGGFGLCLVFALGDDMGVKDGKPELMVCGVETTFDVKLQSLSPKDKVCIELTMTNKTQGSIRFKYSSCIEMHVQLFDSRDKLVPWKQGAPVLECPYTEVEIGAGKTVHRSEEFVFGVLPTPPLPTLAA